MRKILAVVVFLCSAASAYAAEPAKWCSDGYDKPAELAISDSGAVFSVGGKSITLDNEFWRENVTFVEASYAVEGEEHQNEKVVFYQDRVFWPCP